MVKRNNITSYLAHSINYIFHPILLPLYILVILVFASSLLPTSSYDLKVTIIKLVSILTLIIPLLASMLYKLIARFMRIYMSQDSNNQLLAVILAIFYIASIIVLKDFLSLGIVMRLFLCPIFIIIFHNITEYYRIKTSISMMAFGAFSSILYIFSLFGIAGLNVYLFWSFIAAGALASARQYIYKDSITELGIGYIWGFSIAIVSFYLGGIF